MDTPAPHNGGRRRPARARLAWLRLGSHAALAGLVLAIAARLAWMFLTGNFHTVVPGQFYRCSQPSPAHLEQLIRAYGIRTVVNLRGPGPSFDWYIEECRASAELDACQEDVCLSAGRMPAVPELRRLIEVLDRSERPLLFHCQRGADRTGLASAVALLLETEVPFEEARRQLGLRYGHIALSRPANLDVFFDLYGEWLERNGLTHSPDHFRRWAEHDYWPGECRAAIEPLAITHVVPPGEPFAARVRFHNTSPRTWHLSRGGYSGVHASFAVSDLHGFVQAVGRAGLFDAEVPPGQSIDLVLPVPGPPLPGHYTLHVDLTDEQQGSFGQAGSEPLEWEFDVREQEAAAGG
jgi:protein tyrosine/serine phosphatase